MATRDSLVAAGAVAGARTTGTGGCALGIAGGNGWAATVGVAETWLLGAA